MKEAVTSYIKKISGKFKLRFSYFLFIGIIGFILQFISYFLVAGPVSFATLYATKMSASFKSYIAPSYLNLFASLLISVCAIGFIKASKKEQTYVKYSSYALFVDEIFLSIISLVSIICLYAIRLKLKENSANNLIYVLSSCKLIAYLISSISFMGLGYGMMKVEKQDGLGKVGIGANLVLNGLFIVFTFILIFSSLFSDALNTYFSYYVNTNVDISYKTINGFILGQMNGMKEVIAIADSYGNNSLIVTCVFGIIYQIVYLLMMGGSMIFLFTMFIKSYDISKDENRMSL
ncbi:MAG: hypothetical protein ACI4U5_04320 [Bacilli bacterium]